VSTLCSVSPEEVLTVWEQSFGKGFRKTYLCGCKFYIAVHVQASKSDGLLGSAESWRLAS
jgi:hypothetical protein